MGGASRSGSRAAVVGRRRRTGMCFNWKVIGGLVVVAGGNFLVAPSLFVSALPLLLVAACPLSMVFMAKAMMGGRGAAPRPVQAAQPAEAQRSHDEQVARLRAELRSVGEQQATLARQLEELRTAEATPVPDAAPQAAEPASQRVAPHASCTAPVMAAREAAK